jgi:hypothetical protein
MTNIRRYDTTGRSVFITAVCHRRIPYLKRDWQKELLLMDYIHFNPVKHGYVSKPLDYKWSSFNTHVKMGNYAANWGTDTISETIDTMHLE